MIPASYSFMHKTKVFYGALALEQIPPELDQIPARTPLVITEPKTEKKAIRALAGAFARTAAPITVFDQTPDLVEETAIREIADIYKKTGCNSILALGGASVIDTAKAVAVVVTGKELAAASGDDNIAGPLPPFFAIPTMAQETASLIGRLKVRTGTGTLEFASSLLMPRGVFIDSRVMASATGKEVAKSGLAALYRIVDAATGPQQNPVSTTFAACALEMLSANLLKAVRLNSKKQSAILTAAAMLSEIAASNTTQGVGLALSRAVGAAGKVSEDLAGAALVPGLIKLRMKGAGDALSRLLLAMEGPEKYAATAADQRPRAALEALETLMLKVQASAGLKLTAASLGLATGRDEIAKAVAADTDTLGPETVSQAQVAEILAAAE
ncbi:MAG: iron-containing alcohol dehydrogenase [Thermodesulfobacteriota bacterium]|nr:iron-containing alcohol dehydrogenase [Thermodesulfobacteriota bacterium]